MEDKRQQLKQDVMEILNQAHNGRIMTLELLEKLRAKNPLWAGIFRIGTNSDSQLLSRMLKPVHPKTLVIDGGKFKGYSIVDFLLA